MGTNYYAHFNACPHCGRSQQTRHIGKSSAGWKFVLHGMEPHERAVPDSWQDWKAAIMLPTTAVWNEYGERIEDKEEFCVGIERRQKDGRLRTHATEYPRNTDALDADGYSISRCEFS